MILEIRDLSCRYKLIGDTVYVYAIVNGTTDYPRLLK